MDVHEKIISKLESPEGEKIIEKILDEYVESEKITDEKIKKLISSTDYIKWLDNFTKKHPNFDINNGLSNLGKIDEQDKKNVDDLYLMYSAVDRYARKNYIYPIPCNFGGYYKVKLDDNGFEIGKLIGQGTLYFCNRVQIEKGEEFIDFNDIINDKKYDGVDKIKNNLDELSKEIVLLFEESNISLDEITNKLKDAIKAIYIEENNKVDSDEYKLKKLYDKVISLYKSGIPFDAIDSTAYNTIEDLKYDYGLEETQVLKKSKQL